MSQHRPIIAITGANSLTGLALMPLLKQSGAEVIALVRQPQVLEGADQIITDWMNAPAALDALRRADVAIHLTGDLFARTRHGYYEANVATTERLLSAVRGSGVRRIIALTYLKSHPASRNLYLKTNGLREKMLLDSGIETVIFRCPAMIDTPDRPGPTEGNLISRDGEAVRMLGSGKQRQRPIYRGDVMHAIQAAVMTGRPGVYDLVGPEEMSADDLIRLLNRGREVKISHVPGWMANLLSPIIPDLSPTVIGIFLMDSTGDPGPAEREFGLKLTSLRTIWS